MLFSSFSLGVHMKKIKEQVGLILLIGLLLVGTGILGFPFISDYLYWQAANVEIHQFDLTANELSVVEIDERLKLAHAYNSSLIGAGMGPLIDPYSDAQKQEGRQAYAQMLEVNEQMGYVTIEKLNIQLPLFAGTVETVLQKGVGHLEGTSLPVGGDNTHSVLTAHRGLPTASLFTDLDQLVIGDDFYIHTIQGRLGYRVIELAVIEPSDFSQLEVVAGADLVTLLTCTPYMINSHRLIVRGERLPDIDQNTSENIPNAWQPNMNSLYVRWGLYGLAGLVFLVIVIFVLPYYRKRS